jgi:hypothetical protein
MIAEAKQEFEKRSERGFDAFEVWDRKRFIFRYPPDGDKSSKPQFKL